MKRFAFSGLGTLAPPMLLLCYEKKKSVSKIESLHGEVIGLGCDVMFLYECINPMCELIKTAVAGRRLSLSVLSSSLFFVLFI